MCVPASGRRAVEIAVLEEYRAAGSFFDGIFPAGVFKATEVQFSGLGG
ncbi:hypothetical protein [Stenotrophomonas phage CM2]